MTTRISEPQKAERLARAICEDIALYQREALSQAPAGSVVQDALREGAELYQARTEPALHPLFSAAVEARFIGGLAAEQQEALRQALREVRTPPAGAAPPETLPPMPPAATNAVSRALSLMILLALFVVLWVLLGK